jgi:hypothetical protein
MTEYVSKKNKKPWRKRWKIKRVPDPDPDSSKQKIGSESTFNGLHPQHRFTTFTICSTIRRQTTEVFIIHFGLFMVFEAVFLVCVLPTDANEITLRKH